MFNLIDGLLGNASIQFESIICCKCKVPFMVTADHRANLMKTGETFYCPNGHPQYYNENECSKAKKELQKAKQDAEMAWIRNGDLLQENWQLKKQLADAKKTECPHCHKRYTNLQRHIKKQH